jgi:hypothetical protein
MQTHTTYRRAASRARLFAAVAALAAGLTLAPQAHAQGQPRDEARTERADRRMDPAQRLEQRVTFLTQRLQLSSRQQTQVRQILTRENEQMQSLWDKARAQGNGANDSAREGLRQQMRSIHDRTDQQIENVLTAQQRTTYRELRDARRNAQHGGPRRERGDTTDRRPPGDWSRSGIR